MRSSWGKKNAVVATALATCLTMAATVTAVSATAATDPIGAVTQAVTAVTAADKTTQLPAKLAADLAGNTLAWIPATPCTGSVMGGTTTVTPCIIGDTTATKSVVLYGDSFAIEWLGALSILGQSSHFKVIAYGRSACPVASVNLTSPSATDCNAFRKNAIAAIRAVSPAPQVILFSEAHESYWQSLAKNREWQNGLVATLHQLSNHGATIIGLHGVPNAMLDPAQCLSIHSSAIGLCSQARSTAYPYGMDHAEAVAITRALGYPINLSNLFCNKHDCPNVVDNFLTKSGKIHVVNKYALQLAPALGQLIGCAASKLNAKALATNTVLSALAGAATKNSSWRTACAPYLS